MNGLEAKIIDIIQCPVCFGLPRHLPVQSCSQGHIVCQSCKQSMTFCPICRGSLMSNTNTIAGHLSSIVPHPCRFDVFGCAATHRIDTIEAHEKSCPERTVLCPFREDKNRGILNVLKNEKKFLLLSFCFMLFCLIFDSIQMLI